MQIETSCPHCQKSFSVAPALAGKKVRCSSCQKAFQVASGSGAGSGSSVQAKPVAKTPAKPAAKPTPAKPAAVEQSPYESLAASLLNDPKGLNTNSPRGKTTGFGTGSRNANSIPDESGRGDALFDEDSLLSDPVFADDEPDDSLYGDPERSTFSSPPPVRSAVTYNPPKSKTKVVRSKKKAEFNDARAQTGYSIMGLGILGMFAPLVGLELKVVGIFGMGYWFVAGLIVLAGCAFVMSACPGDPKKGLAISAIPALIAFGGMVFSIGLILNGDRVPGKKVPLASDYSVSQNHSPASGFPPDQSFSVPVGSNSSRRSDETGSVPGNNSFLENARKQHQEAMERVRRTNEETNKGIPDSAFGGDSSNPFGSAGTPADLPGIPADAFGGSEAVRSAPRSNRNGTPGMEANVGDLKPGLKVHILWGSRWYDGNVISVQGGSIQVHYDGWSDNFDDTVDISRIRLMDEPDASSGSSINPFGQSGDAGSNSGGSSGGNLLAQFPKDEQLHLTVKTDHANKSMDSEFRGKYGADVWKEKQKHMISPAAGEVGRVPFYAVHIDRTPVLGAIVTWNHDENCLGIVGPVFEESSSAKFQVREGYIVSGINVNADSKVRGVRFVCSRNVDGKPDPNDMYSSEWYGIPASDGDAMVIGGEGRKVYGIWGSKSIHGMESIGLIIEPAK